ncbi:hypothetical protein C8R48DRAFT_774130 [Suillus tomentosus]|nr:hypothetical protein C8R48DRAFT_774130 [Suillus tomentosus]
MDQGEFGGRSVAELVAPYHRMLDSFEKEVVQIRKQDRKYEKEASEDGGRPDEVVESNSASEVDKLSRKKQQRFKLDLSNLTNPSVIRRLKKLPPSLQKTNSILANWVHDPKQVKCKWLESAFIPEFPESELYNIIHRRVVNFNVVFSGWYSDESEQDYEEKLGKLKIKVGGGAEPAKSVHSSQDWSVTYSLFARAMRFAFPHRIDEVDDYRNFIHQKFAQNVSKYHYHVIAFNKAVRKQTCMKVMSHSPDVASMRKGAPQDLSDREDWSVARDGTSNLAIGQNLPATTDMPVPSVEVQSTQKRTARLEPPQTNVISKHPQYLRGMAWLLDESSFSPSAKSSLYATPLPSPGPNDFSDVALDVLNAHPDLFKIITPVNIDTFQELLRDHPNHTFVESILEGLREGFWPCADTAIDGYPKTWDNSHRPLKNEEHQAFVQKQVDEEVRLSCFSPPFGPELLPGMYSTPVHVVLKPNSTKLHLVVDHSAGEFSLNSMINLDNTSKFRREHGDVPLVVFKSDVSQVYRRLPMHPLWQLKQVITVNNNCYVDHCNNFGRKGSALIWVSFMSLVT